MDLIENTEELRENLEQVHNYLGSKIKSEHDEMIAMIKRGTCFLKYERDQKICFAPSRFIGYFQNNLEKHVTFYRHGGDSNKVISKILGQQLQMDEEMENAYFSYAHSLGIKPGQNGSFGAKRKFWNSEIKI